jgi:hypothetical protein
MASESLGEHDKNHPVDPLRDLILFHAWPVDWWITLFKLTGFAAASLAVGFWLAARQIRRIG